MTVRETARQEAESAAGVRGPEADVLASMDAAGLGEATLAVLGRAARQPGAMAAATMRFWTSAAMAGPVAAARWFGQDVAPPVPVPEGDKRFADRTWSDNPAFFALRQYYLAASQLADYMLAAGSGDGVDDAKAALPTGFLLDALAPTSFLFTNPTALKRALEPAGASVLTGAGHMVDDLVNNGGRARQGGMRPVRGGEHPGATPAQG